MDSVNPASSAAALFTNESTAQTRAPEERTPLTSPAPPPSEAPRVNEGPSTVTTISPQAQQLAQQDQGTGNQPSNQPATNASPPSRNDAQQAAGDNEQTVTAEQSNAAPPHDQSGRAFDDQSP